MAGTLPTPTPPNPTSSWKPSDILYILGSAFGFFGGAAGAGLIGTAFPRTYAFLGLASPFLFWAASYAASKGD